ncbi:hypothetical protein D9611_006240 [Ephemerocybe angulata]|uniref:Uncharacterized protein n=2 Tax=Ephemerocybe angulata TaxID=980116 RepID=A0A8H5C879_9AGAR|nr:hypothetical protein D9611_006240 [Tulosesus angulatus]KAF6752954.1 hypothetical protein DFP72DRAFT_902940 [Tulosesus angulatus]
MDIDWCLTCSKHIDGLSLSPYCSQDCRPAAGPSRLPYELEMSAYEASLSEDVETFYHDVEDVSPPLHYTGNDYDGIAAWAAAVVPGAPVCPAPISRPQSSRSSAYSSPSRRSSISNFSPKTMTACPPPNLLRPHRPLPPTLCTTNTPRPAPSKPARPSAIRPAALESTASAAYSTSTGQTTDSSALATPVSQYNVFDTVLSWVSPAQSPAHTRPHSPIDFAHQKPAPSDAAAYLARGRRASYAIA